MPQFGVALSASRPATTAQFTGLNRATEHLAELMMDAALKGALASRRADEIMEK